MSKLGEIIKFVSRRILPHLFIVLAVMFITFQILDGFNPTMGFMSYEVTKILLYIFSGTALVNAIVTLILAGLDDKNKRG